MTIIYVAGPMTGLPDFNYPAFDAAAAQLRALGHEALNPADTEKLNPVDVPQAWDWYMRHALHMVVQADAIALLPGWENSRGATLEHQVGIALGLDVRPLAEWLAPEFIDARLQAVDAVEQLDHDVPDVEVDERGSVDGDPDVVVAHTHGGESTAAPDVALRTAIERAVDLIDSRTLAPGASHGAPRRGMVSGTVLLVRTILTNALQVGHAIEAVRTDS